MAEIPVSELCILRAVAAVMAEVMQDGARPSVVKWRVEQVARLLAGMEGPADPVEADEPTAVGTRTFGGSRALIGRRTRMRPRNDRRRPARLAGNTTTNGATTMDKSGTEKLIATWSEADFADGESIRRAIRRDFDGCSEAVLKDAERAARNAKFGADTDMDVFDSMRHLLTTGVSLDDRAAVERVIINPYDLNAHFSRRFVDWVIKAAKANVAAGGLEMPREGDRFVCGGFVPLEAA